MLFGRGRATTATFFPPCNCVSGPFALLVAPFFTSAVAPGAKLSRPRHHALGGTSLAPRRVSMCESESRSRRRRGWCCGLWEKHKGNGVAPEGAKASAPLAAHGASTAASWWAEAPQSQGSGLNASAISSSQNWTWLQHRPQRTTRRTVHGSRTAQIRDSVAWAAHGMPESPHEAPRPG